MPAPGVSNVMMRTSTTLTVPLLLATALVAGLGAACGDLSQEDLLFKAALPSKHELELQPAGDVSTADDGTGTAAQALDTPCADGDLRCNAHGAAKGFNGVTFALLDLIDRIVNLPPTTRAHGRRVWGPAFLDDSQQTVRFEME